MPFSLAAVLDRSRAGRALPPEPTTGFSWRKFALVGASGYAVNLAVYAALLRGAGLHYLLAAACSFVVAVTNNYPGTGSGPSTASAATSATRGCGS